MDMKKPELNHEDASKKKTRNILLGTLIAALAVVGFVITIASVTAKHEDASCKVSVSTSQTDGVVTTTIDAVGPQGQCAAVVASLQKQIDADNSAQDSQNDQATQDQSAQEEDQQAPCDTSDASSAQAQ